MGFELELRSNRAEVEGQAEVFGGVANLSGSCRLVS